MKSGKWVGVLIILGIVGFFLVLIFSASYTPIQYGSIGLVTRFGKITGRILEPGLHWVVPFVDKVVVYRTQEIVYETSDHPEYSNADYTDYPTDTSTADGQQIIVKFSVRFRIDPEKVIQIAETIGDERAVVEKVVKFHSRILARNIPKEYKALDLYTGNIQQVQDAFEEQLRPLLAEKGIILEAFGLRKIEFTDDYIQAIEQKQIEAENVITERHRAEQAKWKAQAQVELAKGEAEAAVERARGEAQRIQLLAQAEADALRIKGQALVEYPQMLQFQFVSTLSDPNSNVRWGLLPSGELLPILNLTPELFASQSVTPTTSSSLTTTVTP